MNRSFRTFLDSLDNCLHNRPDQSPFARKSIGDAQYSIPLMKVAAELGESKQWLASSRDTAPAMPARSGDSDQLHSLTREMTLALDHAKILASSASVPIVAVAGLLNSGKTSLIAGFLSESGKKRLLIGQGNAQGTHRFVLWLPESWRAESGLWLDLLRQVESVFGIAPEEVSSNPGEAQRQYNAIDSQRNIFDSLSTPLIATDSALDRWKIGLMDCPDIQTGLIGSTFASNANSAVRDAMAMSKRRKQTLEKVLRMASALVVVASANSIRDRCVDDLLELAREQLPGLKKILAINRVPRRYMIRDIADEIKAAYAEHECWRTYLAYHFEGPNDRVMLPPAFPSSSPVAPETVDSLPIFIRIDHEQAAQPPAKIPTADYLVELGSQLSPSQLVRELLASASNRIQATSQQLSSSAAAAIELHNARLNRWQQVIIEGCVALFQSRPSTQTSDLRPVRLQVSREIVSQVAESLERTAPWWAWPSRRMVKFSEKLRKNAVSLVDWITLPKWVGEKVNASTDWIRARWRSGDGAQLLSADSFYDVLVHADRRAEFFSGASAEREVLRESLNAALDRFQNESKTRLNDDELDAFTRELWQRMNWKQRMWTGIAPAGILFAPLVAVVMIPLDFGGSTVIVFASLKELLFAGAAGVGLAMINQDQMPQIAESEAAWQQATDLIAITCDVFHISRVREASFVDRDGRQQTFAAYQSIIPLKNDASNSDGLYPIEKNMDFPKILEEQLVRLTSLEIEA